MAVFEGFQLTLNCDFVAVADRKYCQVFYGRERLLGEEVAAYSFFEDEAFDRALATATALSGKPYFEKLWSAKRFEDRPGGYICLKRLQAPSLVMQLRKATRRQQFKLCLKLIKAITQIHQQGRAHGALDEDNVLYDERLNTPYVLEVLSGFYANQLEPHLCAPEQVRNLQATPATDVFWLGNLFLREIRRPSIRLRQLIQRCTAADSEQRPSLEAVGKALLNIFSSDWEETAKSWLKPQWVLKAAGAAILVSAGAILALDIGFFKSEPPPLNFEKKVDHHLSQLAQEPAKDIGLKALLASATNEYQRKSVINQVVQMAMNDKQMAEPVKLLLRHEYARTPHLQQRERLIAGISDINYSLENSDLRERGYASNFDEQFVGIMLFEWPVLLIGDEIWELGDWVIADGYEGYLSSMSLTHIVLKNGRQTQSIKISTPSQMTYLDWLDQNIYIRGKGANMHAVIHAFKRLGYDVLEEGRGGLPGVISGYFSFATPDDFLETVKLHLKLTVSGSTIWIEDAYDLRTYIPLFHYYVSEASCQDVMANLMQYTGFDFSIIDSCDGPLSVFCVDSELKNVIQSMGFQWDPNFKADQFGFTFSRKE